MASRVWRSTRFEHVKGQCCTICEGLGLEIGQILVPELESEPQLLQMPKAKPSPRALGLNLRALALTLSPHAAWRYLGAGLLREDHAGPGPSPDPNPNFDLDPHPDRR